MPTYSWAKYKTLSYSLYSCSSLECECWVYKNQSILQFTEGLPKYTRANVCQCFPDVITLACSNVITYPPPTTRRVFIDLSVGEIIFLREYRWKNGSIQAVIHDSVCTRVDLCRFGLKNVPLFPRTKYTTVKKTRANR